MIGQINFAEEQTDTDPANQQTANAQTEAKVDKQTDESKSAKSEL